MIPIAATLAKLADRWEADAGTLERYHATNEAQVARRLAGELREALAAAEGEVLTLSEAAAESGYGVDHLRHLVAAGELPNAGRKGAPRIRRGDLPRKAGKRGARRALVGTYDPNADALQLVRGATQTRRGA